MKCTLTVLQINLYNDPHQKRAFILPFPLGIALYGEKIKSPHNGGQKDI
jgi:hypothetical protein